MPTTSSPTLPVAYMYATIHNPRYANQTNIYMGFAGITFNKTPYIFAYSDHDMDRTVYWMFAFLQDLQAFMLPGDTYTLHFDIEYI